MIPVTPIGITHIPIVARMPSVLSSATRLKRAY